MIPFNFEYYRPNTIKDAVKLFNELDLAGKEPIYYGGGSEFISMARMNNVYTEAVIDIKEIKECNEYRLEGDNLIIGAGVTLTRITEENIFPLLSMTVKRIADHTMQGKITIGGNLCGTIIYREAVLPLLVSNSKIVIGDKDGERKECLKDIFNGRLELEKGELLVKVIVPQKFLNLPHLHVKRTRNKGKHYDKFKCQWRRSRSYDKTI
ncbi:MAG: FAD binding domain-containing protein [Tissierella sp.]|uniref:FAD binding domain-containing protein n=1 Tax=Tissierella sp. TaxID=41274 RepID=UPI003F983CDE